MIQIDIESLVGDLQLTKNDLDQVRQLVVKAYVSEVYSETINLAFEKLSTARNEYISALKIVKVDDYTYDLELSGSALALMIESGASGFDMKTGFSKSPKRINTKTGWYLTIPMMFRPTGANVKSGAPGQILPRKIYDLIRNSPSSVKDTGDAIVSTLSNKDIPDRYQPGQLTSLNKAVDAYIPKSSIYAGLNRTQDKESGGVTYNTFRRVSNNSDPKSWLHPGITAYNLMDRAVNNTDHLDIAETALQKFFPTSTVRVSLYNQLAIEMNSKYNELMMKMMGSIIDQIKDLL
jgi:hypothetical protein